MQTGCFRGGTGAPLVLLHSGAHTWMEWRSLVHELEVSREILAPTLPGSDGGPELDLAGRTMLGAMADHVETLLDEAGWTEPVEIVGSSYGGVVALELATRGRASDVTALELATRGRASDVTALAPPWVRGRGLAWYGALFLVPMKAIRLTEPLHGFVASRRLAPGVFFHGSLRPAAVSPEDLAAIWRSVGRFPLLRVGLAGRLEGPGMPAFERVTCPVKLVWGTGDRFVPRWMWERWESALPQAEIEILSGFPHQPHLRHPARVAGLIAGTTAGPAE